MDFRRQSPGQARRALGGFTTPDYVTAALASASAMSNGTREYVGPGYGTAFSVGQNQNRSLMRPRGGAQSGTDPGTAAVRQGTYQPRASYRIVVGVQARPDPYAAATTRNVRYLPSVVGMSGG